MAGLELAPGLLVSMPHLADPNFSRAVVLMIEHDDDGSFGLIINHPAELSVTSLLEEIDIAWGGDPEAPAWAGGPVMPTSGWVLHEPTDLAGERSTDLHGGLAEGATIDIAPGLALSASPESLTRIAAAPPRRTKFVLGYSGWGPGQLADEVSRGSWLHADADPALVFDTPAEEMWSRALRSLGIDPESIVQSRGVH